MRIKQESSPAEVRIAIVNHDPNMRKLLRRYLRDAFLKPVAFSSDESFLAAHSRNPCALAVLDLNFPGLSQLEARQRISKCDPTLPVIFLVNDPLFLGRCNKL